MTPQRSSAISARQRSAGSRILHRRLRVNYCRVRCRESYLCRKNDGHLIRIVGPAFEQVCGWAARGVPIKIACRGIDRYFERYYAKGPRRRPVRVEFCEADVLDVFDEWRRAVGHSGAMLRTPEDAGERGRQAPRDRLPAHLDRVIARLTALRAGEDRSLDTAIDDIVRRTRRGTRRREGPARRGARRSCWHRLRALDDQLIDAARARCDDGTLLQLGEAKPTPSWRRSATACRATRTSSRGAACIDRLIRERRRAAGDPFRMTSQVPIAAWRGHRRSTSRSRPPAAGCWRATTGRSCSSGARFPASACARASSASGKGVLYAETAEVLVRVAGSPRRRGDWRCGGNVFAHVAYPRQLRAEGRDHPGRLGRIGRVPLPAPPVVIGSPEQGYRMRARLHARDGRIGFYPRRHARALRRRARRGQLLPATNAWIARRGVAARSASV